MVGATVGVTVGSSVVDAQSTVGVIVGVIVGVSVGWNVIVSTHTQLSAFSDPLKLLLIISAEQTLHCI
jgi:hypothetical protein